MNCNAVGHRLHAPLVSAVLPTRGRSAWAAQALQCFLSQDYPNKELVVIDDADDLSFPEPPQLEGVRYLRNATRLTIAQKRNQVCAEASGDVIMHVDSDDWSAPERMWFQHQLMMDSGKAVCGFRTLLFYDEHARQAWRYEGRSDYALGTSLAFTKDFWAAHPFQEWRRPGELRLTGSDNVMVKAAADAGQLLTVPGRQMMVARIHQGNTSPKICQTHWKKVNRTELPQGFFA
jgi:glycosyltransferase involved in cell wall biosynthesis